MTAQELSAAIFAGNDVALQWYAVTHNTAIPGAPGSVVVQTPPGGGLSATFGSGTMLLVGVIAIAAIFLLRSK
jgi:hypothetical protein